MTRLAISVAVAAAFLPHHPVAIAEPADEAAAAPANELGSLRAPLRSRAGGLAGQARYSERYEAGRLHHRLELKLRGATPGLQPVFLNGRTVTRVTVAEDGTCSLVWDSVLPDEVPPVDAGDWLQVGSTAAGHFLER